MKQLTVIAQAIRKPNRWVTATVSWWSDGTCSETRSHGTMSVMYDADYDADAPQDMGVSRMIPWETYNEIDFYKSEYAERAFGKNKQGA